VRSGWNGYKTYSKGYIKQEMPITDVIAAVEQTYKGEDFLSPDGKVEILAVEKGKETPFAESEVIFIHKWDEETKRDREIVAIRTSLGWQIKD
jgi:hypothetical protein